MQSGCVADDPDDVESSGEFDDARPEDADPTRITSQAALTTSSGNIWILVGGLFAAIAVAVLIALLGSDPPGISGAGAVIVVLLYAAMVIVRLLVRAGRMRLRLLAIGMLAIAAVSLTALLIVAGSLVATS